MRRSICARIAAPELVDALDGREQPHRRHERDHARDQPHHGEVEPDQVVEAGPPDLDRDLLAGPQRRAVDLGDRGRGDRGPIEAWRTARPATRRARRRSVRATWRQANAPTSSWSRVRARMTCGGNRSGRVDMIWPTFTNVAPSAISSATSRVANHVWRAALPRSVTSRASQPTIHTTPCVISRAATHRPRPANRSIRTGASPLTGWLCPIPGGPSAGGGGFTGPAGGASRGHRAGPHGRDRPGAATHGRGSRPPAPSRHGMAQRVQGLNG